MPSARAKSISDARSICSPDRRSARPNPTASASSRRPSTASPVGAMRTAGSSPFDASVVVLCGLPDPLIARIVPRCGRGSRPARLSVAANTARHAPAEGSRARRAAGRRRDWRSPASPSSSRSAGETGCDALGQGRPSDPASRPSCHSASPSRVSQRWTPISRADPSVEPETVEHRARAERLLADDQRAAALLERRRDDLGRARRGSVDEDDDRQIGPGAVGPDGRRLTLARRRPRSGRRCPS